MQVGVGGGQPAGGGDGHGEAGVDAAGVGVDLFDQSVGIGGFQLGELAPFQDFGRQVVALVGEALQHGGVGAPGAGLHAFAAGEAHAVEQDFPELLGGAEIEGPPGEGVDLGFHHRHALGEV